MANVRFPLYALAFKFQLLIEAEGPPCPAFIEGKCEDGENCRFSHEIDHELEKVEEATPTPRSEPAAMEESGQTDGTIPHKVPQTKHKHHATKSLSIVHTPDPEAKDSLAESSEGITPRPKSMCIAPSEAMRLQLVNVCHFSMTREPILTGWAAVLQRGVSLNGYCVSILCILACYAFPRPKFDLLCPSRADVL